MCLGHTVSQLRCIVSPSNQHDRQTYLEIVFLFLGTETRLNNVFLRIFKHLSHHRLTLSPIYQRSVPCRIDIAWIIHKQLIVTSFFHLNFIQLLISSRYTREQDHTFETYRVATQKHDQRCMMQGSYDVRQGKLEI